MKPLRPIAVGLLLVAVLGGCGGRPDIRVEHRTIDAAPEPLSDAGPPLANYQRAWQRTVANPTGPPSYHLVGGQLVVVSQDAIDAYDARTGRPSWHFREPGRQIDGWTATDGVIVAGFEQGGDTVEERHTLGLDAGTGELLWENTEDWDLTYNGDGSSALPLQPADSADGIVPISVEYDEERLGIEARTGDEVWNLSAIDAAGGNCAPTKGEPISDPSAGVLPVLLDCETQDLASGEVRKLLLLVDPASGEPRWTRRADSSVGVGTAEVRVRGGVTMLEPAAEEAGPELIGPDGRTLFAPEDGRCSVSCELAVSGGRALLKYAAATGRTDYGTEETTDMLASVDLRTGRSSRMLDPGQTIGAPHLAAGGKLYGLSMAYGDSDAAVVTERLLPAGLQVVDVANERAGQAPMPYPTHLMFPPASGTVDQPVAVGGERLFTVRQLSDPSRLTGPYRARIASYSVKDTARPVELGGVSPEDWPDPCALLRDVSHEDYEPEPPQPGPKVPLGDVTLDRTACGRYATTVRIAWVARTEQAARALFPGGEPSHVGADEQRRLETGGMAYRVGRTILYVEGYDDLDAIAEQVITNLRPST